MLIEAHVDHGELKELTLVTKKSNQWSKNEDSLDSEQKVMHRWKQLSCGWRAQASNHLSEEASSKSMDADALSQHQLVRKLYHRHWLTKQHRTSLWCKPWGPCGPDLEPYRTFLCEWSRCWMCCSCWDLAFWCRVCCWLQPAGRCSIPAAHQAACQYQV